MGEIAAIDYTVTGFRAARRKRAEAVSPGDIFLCYLTGKSRFVGALKATTEVYWDEERRIWQSDVFPVRFDTELVVRVAEDRGLHLHDVVGQSAHARSWSGYYRGSPQKLPEDDGEFILARLHELAATQPDEPPIAIEVGTTEEEQSEEQSELRPARKHERIQYQLLTLGADMGYELWVASNDRSSSWNGHRFGDLSVAELPVKFDDMTRRTIELIDVLWLKRNRIEAAFEIESTTSIFSGLLRMADLLAMQPNIDIPLYLVAPEERRKAVLREIRRPVFASLPTPLARACRYIAFERLESELDALGPRTKYLRPAFLNELAEGAS